MTSKRFTDVKAWQEGHQLALFVYKLTKSFPKDEQFALVNQLRCAATSVPSNIAEGFNRYSNKEKVQFYSIALGSASEVHSQLMLARDLSYLTMPEFDRAEISCETVHKLLAALIRSIRT